MAKIQLLKKIDRNLFVKKKEKTDITLTFLENLGLET